jgi:uncharacterized membrane protein
MSDLLARRWPLFLLISLALNCLLVGVVAGRAVETGLAPKPEPQAAQPVQISGFGTRMQVLSDADRRGFLRAMLPARQAIRSARRELADARQTVADAIAREPYDASAVAEAFSALRRKQEAVQELVEKQASQALAAVSPEGRQRLVK